MSEYNQTNYETIKPFEPTNEIEQGYLDDILSVFENEIKVTGIKEYQSPYSTSKTVLIEYVSHPDFNWREDAVFNLLHDKDILDTSIDYTPITPDKSGTINDYLKRLQEESRFDREIEAFVRGELPDNMHEAETTICKMSLSILHKVKNTFWQVLYLIKNKTVLRYQTSGDCFPKTTTSGCIGLNKER